MNSYMNYTGETVILSIVHKDKIVMTFIDMEDLEKVQQGKWNILKKPNGTLYVQGRLPGSDKRVLLHRYLMDNAKVVDHLDRDTLNNRKSNLSDVTTTENVRNRTVTNPTGAHGVFQTPSGKYRVRIKVQGKLVNIGTFDTLHEAIAARIEAEGLHW